MNEPRARRLAKTLAREVALVLPAPLLLLVVRYFSWGSAPEKLLSLASLFAFVALATRRAGYVGSLFEAVRARRVLNVLVAALFAWHAALFVRDIARGDQCLTDMGRPSICAGEWLLRGINPWAECVDRRTLGAVARGDRSTWAWCMAGGGCIDWKGGHAFPNWPHHGPGFDFMDGYKYGPVTALVYVPFTHALRERGLYVVNFAFWLAQCVLIVWLARLAYPGQQSAAARALLILLLPLAIPLGRLLPAAKFTALGASHALRPPEFDTFVLELTQRCSMDIIPVVFGLLSVACIARQRTLASGAWLGLSLAAKQLPGLMWCALFPGLSGVRVWRLVLATGAVAVAMYLPALLWAPRELIANLILFTAQRPTNPSSVRVYLPDAFDLVLTSAQLLGCAVLAFRYARGSERDLGMLLRTGCLMCIVFIALNKVVHGNYLLWLQPLLALTLAGRPFRPALAATVSVS